MITAHGDHSGPLLWAGMPSVVVQELAGHKDIKKTVKYYTGVSKADLRETLKRMHSAAG